MKPAPTWVQEVVNGGSPRPALEAYFQNRGPGEPNYPGTLALDYSLQAMIGLLNFRAWAHCRGDDVSADTPPLGGNNPERLTPEICDRVLEATGDVNFVPDVSAERGDSNVVLFQRSRLDAVLKTLNVEGGTSQLPAETREFR